jgi:hypothetical protein
MEWQKNGIRIFEYTCKILAENKQWCELCDIAKRLVDYEINVQDKYRESNYYRYGLAFVMMYIENGHYIYKEDFIKHIMKKITVENCSIIINREIALWNNQSLVYYLCSKDKGKYQHIIKEIEKNNSALSNLLHRFLRHGLYMITLS